MTGASRASGSRPGPGSTAPTPKDGAAAVRRTRRWGIAVVLWMAFIWGHSLVQGPDSALESGRVVALLRPLFEAVGVFDLDLMSFVVRKCAHFSEYAVLGVLASGLVRSLVDARGPRMRWALLAFALVPVADECLQLFVPGRTGTPRDVLIDLAGACTGALVAWAVCRLRARLRASRG